MIKYVIVLSLLAVSPHLALADSPFPVCKDNTKGIVKDYYESGTLKTEWMCKDGHLNGIPICTMKTVGFKKNQII